MDYKDETEWWILYNSAGKIVRVVSHKDWLDSAGRNSDICAAEPLSEVIRHREAFNKEALRESTPREDCLRTAIKLVTNDRNQQNGDPEDNFATIASFWNTYLHAAGLHPVRDLLPYEVGAMMVLFKMARAAVNPSNPDTWHDVAGYDGCAYELAIGYGQGIEAEETNQRNR